MKTWQKGIITVTLIFLVFIGSLNISSNFANTLSDIPILGAISKTLTFRDYKVSKDVFEADEKVSNVEDLDNEDLKSQLEKQLKEAKKQTKELVDGIPNWGISHVELNEEEENELERLIALQNSLLDQLKPLYKTLYEQFTKEGQKLYENLKKEIEEIQKESEKNPNVKVEIKSDEDDFLSVVVTSLDTKVKTYNIDERNQAIITLPHLFINNKYIEIISENIKEQMRLQMAEDNSKIYNIEEFEQIKPDQNFYVSEEEGGIIIIFDKYEVAPEFMGTPRFVVYSEELSDLMMWRYIER